MAPEKRLIDANNIQYHKTTECHGHGLYFAEQIAYKEEIEQIPAIDAVEVVRCKDCKHFYRHTQIDTDRGDCWCYGISNLRVKHIDDYCSSGERKVRE